MPPSRLASAGLVVLLAASSLVACSSIGEPAAPPTTVLEVATTTVSPADARSDFVSEATGSAPILEGLSDQDLGCVADRLLEDLDPTEVMTLTRNGPRPDQATLAVDALRSCGLILDVVALGLQQAIDADPEAPPVEAACILEGIVDEDLVPYLEARFEHGFVELDDDEANLLLEDTPIMANTMRCSTLALFGQVDAEAPPVCTGLAYRTGDMMAELLAIAETEVDGPDLSVLTGVFAATDAIFAWLVDEVPAELRDDAVLVRDATSRIGALMAEGFAKVAEADPGDEQAAMTAFLGVMARVSAEMESTASTVEVSTERLRDYLVATCGESVLILFELLSGVGATT
ncbi:MAG: hypothetical protein VX782_03935 [Actinomycetota bacterium]|nr:hypothetical protein [Actinomycetota bacterium]MED5438098.1 hypothetical protein [Actinomycetota bacterium]MEE3205594.1 hypothetical protein [Actinomycetota bacterium]